MRKALTGGHDWALSHELIGSIIPVEPDAEQTKKFVIDVLDMYTFLQEARANFTEGDVAIIEEQSGWGDSAFHFRGFDGNNEREHLGVSSFLVNEMGLFESLKDVAALNSHSPSVATYSRMLNVFEAIRKDVDMRTLSTQEVIEIFKAKTHPDNR
ncbi:YfbU family protein [Photobacterium damselae subsp. piscicida]|nr:YfbU family protein [Photobacterium damselae subsp. piscicida]MDP2567942.1 YfbU family protein [Photobacterium damselae subsp. piscicida]